MAHTRERQIPITHELAEVRERRTRPLRHPRVLVRERRDGVEFSVRAPGASAEGAVVCVEGSVCALALPAREGGSWYTSFLLPSDVAGDAAAATLSEGELRLWLPRRHRTAAA